MRRALATVLLGVGVTSCATQERPPDATPAPEAPQVEVQRGAAVYYASRFHGRRTASGVRLDNTAMVAAHPSLPFGCVVGVTSLRDGRFLKKEWVIVERFVKELLEKEEL